MKIRQRLSLFHFKNLKMGCCFCKDNSELLSKMNEFIEKFTREGGFEKLTEKYLAEERKNFDELGFKWFFDLDESRGV